MKQWGKLGTFIAVLIAFGLTALILSACAKDPVAKSPTNNADIKVETLFDYDGCRVYRFYDGHNVYFARCAGIPSINTSWSETKSTGKTSYTEYYDVNTEMR